MIFNFFFDVPGFVCESWNHSLKRFIFKKISHGCWSVAQRLILFLASFETEFHSGSKPEK